MTDEEQEKRPALPETLDQGPVPIVNGTAKCCGTCTHKGPEMDAFLYAAKTYSCLAIPKVAVCDHHGTHCTKWQAVLPSVDPHEKKGLVEEEKIVEDLENQIDPVTTGGKRPDPACGMCRGTGRIVYADAPDNHKDDCDCYTRPHKITKKRQRLADAMTCIKTTDPDTFKPSWSLWADGIEILQLNPEAVKDLTTLRGAGTLPLELSKLILWMEMLANKRDHMLDEKFADGAVLAGGIVNARAKQGAGEVVPNG